MSKTKTNPELVADILIKSARSQGRDIPVCFQDWLGWLVDVFSLDRLIASGFDYAGLMAGLDNEVFRECLTLWVTTANEYQARHECVDFFGEVYEWCFQSRSKASRMGQYFTPYSIGSLMSRCLGPVEDKGLNEAIFNSEPSCGSGRNLLALWQDADWNRRHVWWAEDLDPVSVKMCALNMMINGMFGYVICHNTLFPDDFIFGYAVNEVRDPIPCDYFSIRQISREEYERIDHWHERLRKEESKESVAEGTKKPKERQPRMVQQSLFGFDDE